MMLYCENCKRVMEEVNFYSSKNKEKYPDGGKLTKCKKCLTMHVNSWEPSTFLDILKEVDVPYIEQEWNALLDRYGKDPRKVTGTTIMGRYLAKMKLKQYAVYNWEDTEKLRLDAEKREAFIREQNQSNQKRYDNALASGVVDHAEKLDFIFPSSPPVSEGLMDLNPASKDPFGELGDSVFDMPIDQSLTKEDKIYLALKWGRLYKAEEWIALEKFYEEMMESFDIVGAAHKNYLMMICKTQLKMNQAIDCGDIEGYQKLSKVYDTMMKSSKFTAAQNKADSGEFVDSVGELVYLCEEQGFIPRYDTEEPKDIVDVTLKDMKGYLNRLVTEEMGLGNMIEAALQQMQREEQKEEGDLDENDEYLDIDKVDVLEDADYQEYYDEIEEQRKLDSEGDEG